LADKVRDALEGGIALLQYRRKGEPNLDEARQIGRLAREYAVPMIVNDDASSRRDAPRRAPAEGPAIAARAGARRQALGASR
jgi:thiamine monophosphate synthase